MSKNEICVYILTHNRPNLILRSLNSVRNQQFSDFTIVVSDNSTNNETEQVILPITIVDKRVNYIKRGKECDTGIKHINYIIRNNQYKYFMMFHDDDEMLPNMINNLYLFLIKNQDFIAVGSNAFLQINNKITNKTFIKSDKDIKLKKPHDMALRYARKINDIAPFPSYMYNNNMIKGYLLDEQLGGKYSDASFIISLLNKGFIGLLHKPHMIYYISKNQDSQHHEFTQYLSFIRFLESIIGKENVRERRLYNIFNQIKEIKKQTGKVIFRKKIFICFFKYSPLNYFIKYLVKLAKLY